MAYLAGGWVWTVGLIVLFLPLFAMPVYHALDTRYGSPPTHTRTSPLSAPAPTLCLAWTEKRTLCACIIATSHPCPSFFVVVIVIDACSPISKSIVVAPLYAAAMQHWYGTPTCT